MAGAGERPPRAAGPDRDGLDDAPPGRSRALSEPPRGSGVPEHSHHPAQLQAGAPSAGHPRPVQGLSPGGVRGRGGRGPRCHAGCRSRCQGGAESGLLSYLRSSVPSRKKASAAATMSHVHKGTGGRSESEVDAFTVSSPKCAESVSWGRRDRSLSAGSSVEGEASEGTGLLSAPSTENVPGSRTGPTTTAPSGWSFTGTSWPPGDFTAEIVWLPSGRRDSVSPTRTRCSSRSSSEPVRYAAKRCMSGRKLVRMGKSVQSRSTVLVKSATRPLPRRATATDGAPSW